MINKFIRHLLKVDKYEIQDGNLVCHKGLFKREIVQRDQIKAWSVYPEMGMDIVVIDFTDGKSKRMTDMYDDLIDGLKKIAGEKQKN